MNRERLEPVEPADQDTFVDLMAATFNASRAACELAGKRQDRQWAVEALP